MSESTHKLIVLACWVAALVVVSGLTGAACYEATRDAPDTGTYQGNGVTRVVIDGKDMGLAPGVPGIIEWSAKQPVDRVVLGSSHSKYNPYCKNGKLVVVWEGNEPTRDGDACVWRCGP